MTNSVSPGELTNHAKTVEAGRKPFSALAINSGSSSLQFAFFKKGESLAPILTGKFDRIGLPDAVLSLTDVRANQSDQRGIDAPNHVACVPQLMDLLEQKAGDSAVSAIGHRVVQGDPRYRESQRMDKVMLVELMMSTHSGDLDPGLVAFLGRSEQMTGTQFHRMIHHESGLLGISETSSDMRDLLAAEATDERAAEAIALFCYQVEKWIGAYAAVLGGLEMLVFAGGIGENAPQIRERICANLDFLGIKP